MKIKSIVSLTLLITVIYFSACDKKEAAKPAQAESPVVTAQTESPTSSASNQLFGATTLSGTVSFSGKTLPAKKNPASSSPDCHADVNDPEQLSVRVRDGKLMNAFVYIKEGIQGAYPTAALSPAVLDQKHCAYLPRIIGVQVGQTLEIRNSDPTLHNVHSMAKVSAGFNIGMPKVDMKVTKILDKPEVMIPIKCDVHPWMKAYVGALTHPFFSVSREDGTFSIEKLPAGSYTVEVWHETLGTQTQQITTDGQAPVSLSFEYK